MLCLCLSPSCCPLRTSIQITVLPSLSLSLSFSPSLSLSLSLSCSGYLTTTYVIPITYPFRTLSSKLRLRTIQSASPCSRGPMWTTFFPWSDRVQRRFTFCFVVDKCTMIVVWFRCYYCRRYYYFFFLGESVVWIGNFYGEYAGWCVAVYFPLFLSLSTIFLSYPSLFLSSLLFPLPLFSISFLFSLPAFVVAIVLTKTLCFLAYLWNVITWNP